MDPQNLLDIVIELVLYRLPLKVVLGFKLLSKHWQTYITSYVFAQNYSKIYLQRKSLVALSGDALSIFVEDYEKYILAIDNLELLGSVNGIVALLRGSILCFINPLTRYSYEIELPEELKLNLKENREGERIGYGFDTVKKTYKIVVVQEELTWVCTIKSTPDFKKDSGAVDDDNSDCWNCCPSVGMIFGPRLEFDLYDQTIPHCMIGSDPVWVQSKKGGNSLGLVLYDMHLEKFRCLCDFVIKKKHDVFVKFLQVKGVFSAFEYGSEGMEIFNYSQGWHLTSKVEIRLGSDLLHGVFNTDDMLVEEISGNLYICCLNSGEKKMLFGGASIRTCVSHTASIHHLPEMRGIDLPTGLRNGSRLLNTLRGKLGSNEYKVKTASPNEGIAAEASEQEFW